MTVELINRLVARASCLAAAFATALLQAAPAEAQASPSLIRDAEIEATIRAYADPLFSAAGLDAAAIKVHLIESDQINAFVAPGNNMFIYTGLLMRADSPNQVIGVIAHETGHIADGHLVRIQQELHNATIESIIAMVAGIGAGVATGNAGVGMGAAAIGQGVAQRNLLKYSRVQEASADQAGMRFLDASHQSARGLLEFFQKLEGEEYLMPGSQDPYLQTHPLTRDRIESVQQHVDNSPYSDAKDTPALVAMHLRMLAKLKGYIWPLDRVMQAYPPSDNSQPARYARAIALYRVSRTREALALMGSLLKESPQDPFYLEQTGQILFENGRLADALPYYQRAAEIRPRESLLRLELGQVQIETEQPQYVKPAIANLEFATQMESNDPFGWQLLAVAYGRDNQLGMSALAQAEQALASGNKREAKAQAKRALKGLPDGSPGWLRANDIVSAAGGPDDNSDQGGMQ
ncbi:MAG TPA: M48 family metalloprotease [Candidatus Cybelea sp.]|nr:M48 family metalloprotease [Candidatus Cybelea sp.]